MLLSGPVCDLIHTKTASLDGAYGYHIIHLWYQNRSCPSYRWNLRGKGYIMATKVTSRGHPNLHANPYFNNNPIKDSIIKQVVIASELKMMFNMLLLIFITLLKIILSNPQFITERNSGHIFRVQILHMQWRIFCSQVSFFHILKNIYGYAIMQE